MGKKSYSLIIIPHHRGKQRTIRLSEKKIKLLVGIASFISVLLIVFLVDYFMINGARQKYRVLSEENIKQREAIVQYKDTINKLKESIDDFEKYAKKLNIMAGLKSSEELKEFGIGASGDQEIIPVDIPQNVNLDHLKSMEQKANGIERNLSTLVSFFENQELRLAGTPSVWPVRGYLSSVYGWRDDPFTQKRTFHWGIDIATHYGNSIVATADGIVIQRTTDKIGGNTIKISHRGGYTTIYCHLSKFLARPGQRVKRGDVIGLVGKTGKALGPHVHYEVKRDGKNVNPWYYLLEE